MRFGKFTSSRSLIIPGFHAPALPQMGTFLDYECKPSVFPCESGSISGDVKAILRKLSSASMIQPERPGTFRVHDCTCFSLPRGVTVGMVVFSSRAVPQWQDTCTGSPGVDRLSPCFLPRKAAEVCSSPSPFLGCLPLGQEGPGAPLCHDGF